MTEKMGLIGPEVSDRTALEVQLDRADILVTEKEVLQAHQRGAAGAARCRTRFSSSTSSAVAFPSRSATTPSCSAWTSSRWSASRTPSPRSARCSGGWCAPSTATDLLTLSAGMVLGFLIGAIQFPAFGAKVGLGNAGGLLVSGVIVSSVASRLRFFGNTPNAARNVLEDLGLVVFVAIVGINAGNSLLTQLTGVSGPENLHRRLHRLLRARRSSSGPSAIMCSR